MEIIQGAIPCSAQICETCGSVLLRRIVQSESPYVMLDFVCPKFCTDIGDYQGIFLIEEGGENDT